MYVWKSIYGNIYLGKIFDILMKKYLVNLETKFKGKYSNIKNKAIFCQ